MFAITKCWDYNWTSSANVVLKVLFPKLSEITTIFSSFIFQRKVKPSFNRFCKFTKRS